MLSEVAVWISPIAIAIALALFVVTKRRIDKSYYSSFEFLEDFPEGAKDIDKYVEKLVQRNDIDLRTLEEVTELEKPQRYPWIFRGKARRERILEQIQEQLRRALRAAVDTDEFEEIRSRIIRLLDEIHVQLEDIRQKEPFEGLDDPERSLLIDLLEEIPSDRKIPRQKAQQLADILKIKHQDIRKLQIENKKAATWTRWGTIGTVSFGLLSIFLSVYAISSSVGGGPA